MSDKLNQATVLVLNRNWQAIGVRTPAEAFCQMMTGVATGLDIEGQDLIRPVRWEEWLRLSIRPQDRFVRTVRGPVRLPTVMVLASFAKVPKRRPKLTANSIRERDSNRCQYTGVVLAPNEGNIDHVVPRSRGGKTTWKNCVWASRQINARKGDRLPEEAGLRLIRRPQPVPEMPVTRFIRNGHGIPDWKPFLGE